MSVKVFSRFDLPPSPSIKFAPGSSLTRQEFAAECDINTLVSRYQDTGSFYDPITEVKASARQPFFGDFSNVPDYQESLDIVIQANEAFSSLPSKVRERFENDPAKLLAFLSDEKNREEAISLGLVAKPVEPPSRPAGDEQAPEKPPQAAK